jgi:hypothetical protein
LHQDKIMFELFRRVTHPALQGGEQTTSYQVNWQAWIPIAASALAAISAFGNFVLSLGVHANWWK